jgi:hypothetical protein
VSEADRPIDRQRNAGFMVEIPGQREGAIREMIGIGEKLYAVKDEAIYSFVLADQIDPDRTNPHIQHVQQREYSVGATSPLVGRTLFTARYLFKDGMLDARLEKDLLMKLALEFFEEVLALSDMVEAFVDELNRRAEEWNQKQKQHGASVLLPSVPDLKGKIKSFVQRADHAAQSLLALGKIFYPCGEKKGFDGVLDAIKARGDAKPEQIEFAETIVEYWKFLRNCRNCVEHPQPHQKIAVTNFAMNADGRVELPTMEVIHKRTPEPRMEVAVFVAFMLDSVLHMGEDLMAFLAATNVQPGWESVTVMEFPPESRLRPHVRYYFAMNMNGTMIPIG